MTDWLPGEPNSGSGSFLRMKHLDNYPNKEVRLRVLELPFVHGYQRFKSDNKPVMCEPGQKFPDAQWKHDDNGPRPFWACPVWNYNESKVQVWSFTQSTIYNALKGLGEDSDWGDPSTYDLKIRKSGSGMETEYAVKTGPKSPLDAVSSAAWAKVKEDWTGIKALFSGGDPFKPWSESDLPF